MAASEISRWMKRQRAKRRQTQAEVAEAIGMSRTWVSSLEGGTFRPPIEECIALARWARVPLPEVLSAAGYSLSVIAALRSLAAESPESPVNLTPDDLDAIAERSARRVIQILRDEGWAPSQGDGGTSAPPQPSQS